MADTYRLLLDENLEHEIRERLDDAGQDVEHVDNVSALGRGAADSDLAAYSLETNRAIATYEDAFIRDVPETSYGAVIFFEARTLSAKEVASILHSMAQRYPFDDVVGLRKSGRQWVSSGL